MSIIINLIQSILITEMPVTHSSRVSPLIVSGELSGLLVTYSFATHHSALLVSKEYLTHFQVLSINLHSDCGR